jgi:hypothetical protein
VEGKSEHQSGTRDRPQNGYTGAGLSRCTMPPFRFQETNSDDALNKVKCRKLNRQYNIVNNSGLEAVMDDRKQHEIEDRRKFLISAGRFAAVTPPAITLLLSTSLTSDAIASSGLHGHSGPKGNNGYGNGGGDNSPNGKDDKYR